LQRISGVQRMCARKIVSPFLGFSSLGSFEPARGELVQLERGVIAG
jgi:hypothetical protein